MKTFKLIFIIIIIFISFSLIKGETNKIYQSKRYIKPPKWKNIKYKQEYFNKNKSTQYYPIKLIVTTYPWNMSKDNLYLFQEGYLKIHLDMIKVHKLMDKS
jgi:hypothetical protein